jgi:hypothetical protein
MQKRYLSLLAIALSIGFAVPVFASYRTMTRDCRPYQYEVQPVLHGTIFRVKDDGRVRETFFPSRELFLLPGCQGSRLAFSQTFTGKYSSSILVSLVDPEGPELRIEKALEGSTGANYGSFLPENRITTIKGIVQKTAGVMTFNTNQNPATQNPVEISYLNGGNVTKRQVPLMSDPSSLPWPDTTSTMVYFAEYSFDGQDVFVHEVMFERDGDQYDDWMNRWSKLQNGTYVAVLPPDFTAEAPTGDRLYEPLAEIRSKARLANQSDMLNDRSYYVFGANGSPVRRIAPSSWNSILGERELHCDDVTYTLYQKQLAAEPTAASTYPSIQYVVERVRGTSRKLIPVPHVDQSWKRPLKPGALLNVGLEACLGGNAVLNVVASDEVKNALGETYPKDILHFMVITPNVTYVNYLDKNKTISADTYSDGRSPGRYFIAGAIFRTDEGVGGDATLAEVLENGTVVRSKPAYFRDIRQYPVGTRMTFYRHRDTDQFVVQLSAPDRHYSELGARWTHEVYVFENGQYQKVPDVNYVHQILPPEYPSDFRPIYVAAQKDMLTLKSYFLERTTLLHYLPGKTFTLDWYRISPVAKDGSQKVWYAFTTDGRQQTWVATIR